MSTCESPMNQYWGAYFVVADAAGEFGLTIEVRPLSAEEQVCAGRQLKTSMLAWHSELGVDAKQPGQGKA